MGPAAVLAIGGFAALLAALAAGKKSGAAETPPPGAEPTEFSQLAGKAYVTNTARAASGRTYQIWMWPPIAGVGVYTVARLAGSTAWIAFTYNADTNQRTPVKTNVMQLPISDAEKSNVLTLMRTDWNLPG